MLKLMIFQLGYEEVREILVSGKYTHWQNVVLLWLKFLHFYNAMQN
jgi:hypothetical protein